MGGLLEMILKSQNGAAVEQLARNFGVSGEDATRAIAGMLPGLSSGMQSNISSPEGLESLGRALHQGRHQQYLERPETLGDQSTIQDGNNILGHILGSKDASRQLAGEASARTGLDSGTLKKMLPAIAAMLMGGLSKQQASAGGLGQAPAGAADSSALGSMLTSFLDADKDGSIADDLLGMARKLF
jgi:hypothetical protein